MRYSTLADIDPIRSPQARLKDQAIAWHTRLTSGRCTDDERVAFSDWLAQSEEHRRIFHEIEQLWRRLDGLKSRAAQDLATARSYHSRPTATRRPGYRLAAVSVCAAVIAAFGLAVHLGWQPLPLTETYQTAKGEQRSLTLADGSRIDLNTDTELTVAYTNSMRSVHLRHGEALFSVQHQAQRPFEVIAAKGRIRDLGTRFNVYENAGRVTVAVFEGEVGIATNAFPGSQRLAQGQQASYDADGKPSRIEAADLDTVTAWREGKLIFRSRPLAEVAEQLARYHHVSLQIPSPNLQRLKVSGTFATSDLPLLLKAIETTLPVKVHRLNAAQIRIEALAGQGRR